MRLGVLSSNAPAYVCAGVWGAHNKRVRGVDITQHTYAQTRARQKRWAIKQFPVESVCNMGFGALRIYGQEHMSPSTGSSVVSKVLTEHTVEYAAVCVVGPKRSLHKIRIFMEYGVWATFT